MPPAPIIFDFDSTLCAVESLDRLAEIVLDDDPEAEAKVTEIERLTNLGMEGAIPLSESLSRRLATLRFDRTQVDALIKDLQEQLTPGLPEDTAWIQTHAERLHVVSGGFIDWIAPVLIPFGFRADQIHANVLQWKKDQSVGFNQDHPLAHNGGKPELARDLGLGPNTGLIAVGDGISDLELKRTGVAERFVAYTAHAQRHVVVREADAEATSWADLRELLDQA